jgi:hypothetical protein
MNIIEKIKKYISIFTSGNSKEKDNFLYFVCGSESLPLPLPQEE